MQSSRTNGEQQQRMTWKEIQAAYPEQWVVLGALDDDPVTQELRSAIVRGHGATRREASDAAIGDDGELLWRRYTGRPKRTW